MWPRTNLPGVEPLRVACAAATVVLGLVGVGTAGERQTDDTPAAVLIDTFFRNAEDKHLHLPPERIYPRGRRFPFTGFNLTARQAARDGFTMIGGMYHFSEQELWRAQQHGIGAVGYVTAGWSKDELADVSQDDVVARVRERVEEVLGWEGASTLEWWYLRPEELRYWREHELDYLKWATQAIRDTDPQRRPIWMYDPNHRSATDLGHTAAHLDIVGKGMYTNHAGQKRQRVWCRWTIEQQKLAIQWQNPAAIPIAVPEMFRHPNEYLPQGKTTLEQLSTVIQRWVRHDLYAALIAGARGVAVYAFAERAGDEDRLPFRGRVYSAYYEAYAQIARELTGEMDLGPVFLFGEPRKDIKLTIVEGPRTIDFRFRDHEAEYSAVDMLDVAYRDRRYAFLVNSTEEPITVELAGLPAEPVHVHELFGKNTFEVSLGRFSVTLNPLQVKGFRFTRSGD
ncbi:hypothetical protein ACERK3_11475 [Phycisphaerales bacterium AB-hyl4]|uniref:Glycoside hydrolase family 42 N-terminal domain-containing protein n=1 Tax=Natronomicrosphaera hydrolytica TaxID=3242702 RepID=A0ABV4U5V5_9BACT